MNRMKAARSCVLILAVAMIAPLFCGCARSDTGSLESTNPTTSETTAVTESLAAETTQMPTVSTQPFVEPTQETAPSTVETTAPTEEIPTEVTQVTEPEFVLGEQIAQLARDQLGKPYLYGGAGPDEFDASGLVHYCYGAFDIDLPRSVKDQSEAGIEIPVEEIQPGDAVFFWNDTPGTAQFVGIYVGNGKFIAACNSSKPVVEMTFGGSYYEERFVFARRFYE